HEVYLEDIILHSNNKNAYDVPTLAQPTVNLESIIKLNPDIVILLAPYLHQSSTSKEELIKAWKSIPINASQKSHIYVVDKEYAGIPSQRVQYFIEDYKKALEDVASK
ncbi:MAG: iron ABC transporter substrate-binding protein, partial [Deltaproteobacteria bacterium HGW-Deltaproteobacteria-24]